MVRIGLQPCVKLSSEFYCEDERVVKVKEVERLYCSTSHSRRSGTDHTVLPANYTVPASTS